MEAIAGFQALLWEFFGTTALVLLGNGVCAAVNLRTTHVVDAGRLGTAFGWGLAVFTGASIADVFDGYLNPAVAVALTFDGTVGWNLVPYYVTGQLLGAFIGAILAQTTSKQLLDANGTDNNGNPTNTNTETGGSPFIAPLHPNNFWNAVIEFLVTFVLFLFTLLGPTGGKLGPLRYFGVSSIIVSIGLSLSSPTGYAVNSVCDLGPHLAYALALPIKGKGDTNWPYAWVPTVTPMLAVVAIGTLALVT